MQASNQRVRDGNSLLRGRKFNADELQLVLLCLLRETPAHGYQLIKQLNELSQGYYSPSPGVLYPALGQLEAQRLTEVELQGKRKRYRVTDSGLQHLQNQHERVNLLFATLRHAAKRMQWLALAGQGEAKASAVTGWLPEFIHARTTLRDALLACSEAGPDEQRRITRILQRTADEILNVSDNP